MSLALWWLVNCIKTLCPPLSMLITWWPDSQHAWLWGEPYHKSVGSGQHCAEYGWTSIPEKEKLTLKVRAYSRMHPDLYIAWGSQSHWLKESWTDRNNICLAENVWRLLCQWVTVRVLYSVALYDLREALGFWFLTYNLTRWRHYGDLVTCHKKRCWSLFKICYMFQELVH